MAQAVTRRPVTVETRLRVRLVHVGFVADKVVMG
jgi:hypothetical protein